MTDSNQPILHHRLLGDRTDTPIVMIHPLGGDETFWDAPRGQFGQGFFTISLDLRGTGRSPDLDEPLTLDRTAADIEALRRSLGLGRIVVLGCALGAMAAARYASLYGDATLALVMSNPGLRILPAGAKNLADRAASVRAEGMAALLPQAVENAFTGYEGTAAMRDYERKFRAHDPENYALSAIGAADSDISGDLARLRCPVLLIAGRNDRLFPPELHADPIAAALPEATRVDFPDGAHFIPYQQPEAFGATVAAFLSAHVHTTNSG